MKSFLTIVCAMLAAGAAAQAGAQVSGGLELAKAKNCMACHTMTRKAVGPSFKDVSLRYAGQKDAEDKLVHKVLKGGAGVWGVLVMPANVQVSEAEAHTLVKWILTQK